MYDITALKDWRTVEKLLAESHALTAAPKKSAAKKRPAKKAKTAKKKAAKRKTA